MIASVKNYKIDHKDLSTIYQITLLSAKNKLTKLKRKANTNRLTPWQLAELENLDLETIKKIVSHSNRVTFID